MDKKDEIQVMKLVGATNTFIHDNHLLNIINNLKSFIHLSNSPITDDGTAALTGVFRNGALPTLRILDLRGTHAGHVGVAALVSEGRLPHLQELLVVDTMLKPNE